MSLNWVPLGVPLEQHPNYPLITYLSRQFLIDPIIGHYLFLHGFNNEEKIRGFLEPNVLKDLHDPFLMIDMKKAVIRIIKAIMNKEKILIFGDYDCDGITSTSLLYLALRKFKGEVTYRLPLRSEGYGLSADAMKQIDEDISLVITVDNGTSSHEAMMVAKEKGIDVIVTDHHEILGPYPNCYAFINPKRHDNKYPFTSLSGAGVALKIVQALYIAAKRKFDLDFHSYLELATLGTIADLMPIIDENRVICSHGLRIMNLKPHPVFKRIFEKSFIKIVDSSSVGFTLGPILNSCGRIGDPNIAVDILTKAEIKESQIDSLIKLNSKRKELTNHQFILAENQIKHKKLHNDKVIVVFGDFHNGIIGIIASKITEKYKKPSIVISTTGTGSARSVNGSGFSIINVIKHSSHLLKKYGGHQAAAGLSITPEETKIHQFRTSILQAADNELFNAPAFTYIRKMEIENFYDELFESIAYLEPYGINIPKPLFYSDSKMYPSTSVFGTNHEHMKMIYQKNEAIAFFKGSLNHTMSRNSSVHALYSTFCNKKKNFLIHSLHVE